jgi:hypothetical protein
VAAGVLYLRDLIALTQKPRQVREHYAASVVFADLVRPWASLSLGDLAEQKRQRPITAQYFADIPHRPQPTWGYWDSRCAPPAGIGFSVDCAARRFLPFAAGGGSPEVCPHRGYLTSQGMEQTANIGDCRAKPCSFFERQLIGHWLPLTTAFRFYAVCALCHGGRAPYREAMRAGLAPSNGCRCFRARQP